MADGSMHLTDASYMQLVSQILQEVYLIQALVSSYLRFLHTNVVSVKGMDEALLDNTSRTYQRNVKCQVSSVLWGGGRHFETLGIQ